MIANSPGLPEETHHYLLDRLCPHYAWADGLSAYYAGALRSSSLATSLLAAISVMVPMVGCALRSTTDMGWSGIPRSTEFSLIVIILAITWHGRRKRWHERWLNLRQLAELLRQYCYLAPLGCPLATPPPPAHFRSGLDRSWVDGMFRNIARDLGLAPAVVNHAYVSSVAKLIADILEGQVKYHEGNHETMHKLSHRLHLHRHGFVHRHAARMRHACSGGMESLLAAPAGDRTARFWRCVLRHRQSRRILAQRRPFARHGARA